MSERTDLQEEIIEQHKKDESKTDEEIAVEVDASTSYVNKTRNEYDAEGNSSGSTGKVLLLIILAVLFIAFASGSGDAATIAVTTTPLTS